MAKLEVYENLTIEDTQHLNFRRAQLQTCILRLAIHHQHLLYSWRFSSFTAWMSLSWAIRAWTLVLPSRPVMSIFSIICCCLSIQYSQFSNTVSPTGCRMLVSSNTIRLAPWKGECSTEMIHVVKSKIQELLTENPLGFQKYWEGKYDKLSSRKLKNLSEIKRYIHTR